MDQVFKGECALSVDTTELSASIWVGMHGRSTETEHSHLEKSLVRRSFA